jgi:hypothetical protein
MGGSELFPRIINETVCDTAAVLTPAALKRMRRKATQDRGMS